MTFRQALRVSSLCCFAGVVVGGYIASFALAVANNLESSASLQQWLLTPLAALLFMFFAAGYAVLPALAIGWPGYAWLVYAGKASYVSAGAIAVVVALAAWALLDRTLAVWVGVYGICMALATHSALPRGSRWANTSFLSKL